MEDGIHTMMKPTLLNMIKGLMKMEKDLQKIQNINWSMSKKNLICLTFTNI